MFYFSHWLSLYWFLLLPLASILAALSVCRSFRLARRRALLTGDAYQWLVVALAASQAFIGLLLASSVYETVLWLPLGALLATLVMALGAKQAAHAVHPGLHGFLRPLPRDGLELIDWELTQRRWQRRLGWAARRISPFVLAGALCIYVLANQSGRWPGLWLTVFAVFSPLLIVPVQRRWLASLFLVPLVLAFGQQALQLRAALPPGRWITPVTSANCSNTVRLNANRTVAWCADENTGRVYQFQPGSGLVDREVEVEFGAQVLAGDANRAWVRQNPMRGLVRVERDQQVHDYINFPRQGTVDAEGRLWFIDVSYTLRVNEPGSGMLRFRSADGLLGNTANVVKTAPDGAIWVGSVGGVSFLPAGATEWQRISRHDGLPGAVHDIAFAADGSTWFMWKASSASGGQLLWGVSYWKEALRANYELGDSTGLNAPASQDALAVDGLGRVWFTAVSYNRGENYLGILAPDDGQISLYSLGPFVPTSNRLVYVPGSHGVVDDGRGGIYLYNPSRAPFRHWRPD